ncbi:MAG: glutamate cyclase domain-containing protein, partial [Pirellulales bacterium]
VTTIGIGDGGNEIGMGSFRWDVLRRALGGEPAGRIVCRIAADHAILAGVSNWGAYALALAVCRLSERVDLAATYTTASQRRLIETIVAETDAVDGVTKKREATVDGIALADYLATLADLRRVLV